MVPRCACVASSRQAKPQEGSAAGQSRQPACWAGQARRCRSRRASERHADRRASPGKGRSQATPVATLHTILHPSRGETPAQAQAESQPGSASRGAHLAGSGYQGQAAAASAACCSGSSSLRIPHASCTADTCSWRTTSRSASMAPSPCRANKGRWLRGVRAGLGRGQTKGDQVELFLADHQAERFRGAQANPREGDWGIGGWGGARRGRGVGLRAPERGRRQATPRVCCGLARAELNTLSRVLPACQRSRTPRRPARARRTASTPTRRACCARLAHLPRQRLAQLNVFGGSTLEVLQVMGRRQTVRSRVSRDADCIGGAAGRRGRSKRSRTQPLQVPCATLHRRQDQTRLFERCGQCHPTYASM